MNKRNSLNPTVTPTLDSKKIEIIKEVVAKHFHFDIDVYKRIGRQSERVLVQQIAMFFCKELTGFKLREIGSFFGHSHSMVIFHSKSVSNRIDTNPQFKEEINSLRHLLSLYIDNMDRIIPVTMDKGRSIVFMGYDKSKVELIIKFLSELELQD